MIDLKLVEYSCRMSQLRKSYIFTIVKKFEFVGNVLEIYGFKVHKSNSKKIILSDVEIKGYF